MFLQGRTNRATYAAQLAAAMQSVTAAAQRRIPARARRVGARGVEDSFIADSIAGVVFRPVRTTGLSDGGQQT